MSCTSVACSMFGSVHLVFRWGGPTEMRRGYATSFPISTRVSGLMRTRWRRTVDFFTNRPMRVICVQSIWGSGVSILMARKRPYQTIVSGVSRRYFNKSKSAAGRGLATKGGAVFTPSGPMSCTPPSPSSWLDAIWNRAYAGSSHVDLLTGWLVRARRDVASIRRVRFLYPYGTVVARLA
jgi:hypothetical protein